MLSHSKYAGNILKEYKYWTLFLHERQNPYVGRCYAWWKDRTVKEGEGFQLHWIPEHAIIEFFHVISADVMRGCAQLGYPTGAYGKRFLLNQAFLCNEVATHNAHLHGHFIPRYNSTLVIPELSMTFTDELWGKHYLPMKDQIELRPHEHAHIHRTMMDTLHD